MSASSDPILSTSHLVWMTYALGLCREICLQLEKAYQSTLITLVRHIRIISTDQPVNKFFPLKKAGLSYGLICETIGDPRTLLH
jgi:hypothetical protein